MAKKANVVKVKFAVAISNNGDGSASPRFFKTLKEAKAWEDKEREEYGDGWGESCAYDYELTFKDGKLTGFDDEGYKEY